MSDLEGLEFAWKTFGKIRDFELSEITHRYPEWKKHEKTLERDTRVRMRYEDFFEDPVAGEEKCFELTKEEKRLRLDYLEEISRAESVLG